MLEHHAGIPDEKIVQSHGSFSSARCIKCGRKCENMEEYWYTIENNSVPRCSCSNAGIIKPEVTFFGESLPARFSDLQEEDFEACDLLIVIGTSLTVYPFASLANKVDPKVPRLV